MKRHWIYHLKQCLISAVCLLGVALFILYATQLLEKYPLGDPARFPRYHAIAWSPDGQYIAVTGEEGLHLFDARLNPIGYLITVGGGEVAWSADSKSLLATTGDLISAPSLEIKRISPFSLASMAWSHYNGQIAYIDVRYRDTDTDHYIELAEIGPSLHATHLFQIAELKGPTNHYQRSLKWSPTSDLLALPNYEHEIEIWDTDNYELVYTLRPARKPADKFLTFSICWKPDGTKLASYDYGNIIYLWDIESGTLENQFPAGSPNKDFISDIEWSPDGSQIASANGYTLYIWDAQTFKRIRSIESPGYLYQLAWSPDGQYIATIGTKRGRAAVWLWDINTGDLIAKTR